MHGKAFRFDWNAQDSLIDLSRLEVEEIGVLMQIINLIYCHNGPIDNDPKHIGKVCNITRARARRIICSLITKGHIYITAEGKISKKRCELELQIVEERRKKYSKNGKKGAEIRHEIKENQQDKDSVAMSDVLASIRTNTNNNKETNNSINDPDFKPISAFVPGSYKIGRLLTPQAIQKAKQNAPGWDIYHLMSTYDSAVNSGKLELPRKPNAAFPAWCEAYTKGRPP